MNKEPNPYKNYKSVNIFPTTWEVANASIMVIYTGGTLGMVYDDHNHHLVPFDFESILSRIPELNMFGFNLTVVSFNELIDSANVSPWHWIELAGLIEANYNRYNGFVIIHGTDTMAFSASALSYLLENLNKPVIFTGAQLPIGAIRTDARENLVTALEIAAARKDGRPLVPEVCIYFNNQLLRGNRAKKVESAQFGAFESANYPSLASCGTRIDFNPLVIKPYQPFNDLKVHKTMEDSVSVVKLFPGMSARHLQNSLSIPGVRGIILETYGSGNAPTNAWFLDMLKEYIEAGHVVFNVSQCNGGTVMQGRYETSKTLANIGVVSGNDITLEAAITKMMFIMAENQDKAVVERQLSRPIRGEMS